MVADAAALHETITQDGAGTGVADDGAVSYTPLDVYKRQTPDAIRQLIEQGLPDAQVQVFGDDGVHFEALVVSEACLLYTSRCV